MFRGNNPLNLSLMHNTVIFKKNEILNVDKILLRKLKQNLVKIFYFIIHIQYYNIGRINFEIFKCVLIRPLFKFGNILRQLTINLT